MSAVCYGVKEPKQGVSIVEVSGRRRFRLAASLDRRGDGAQRRFGTGTHPLLALCIRWRSFRHCSQKYSSGELSSVMMPTHAPCCQTLQMSHWT